MQRTRRIEVIRYRRQVNVVEGTSQVREREAAEGDDELILDTLAIIAPPPEEVSSEVEATEEGSGDEGPGPRLLRRLGGLLWPRR